MVTKTKAKAPARLTRRAPAKARTDEDEDEDEEEEEEEAEGSEDDDESDADKEEPEEDRLESPEDEEGERLQAPEQVLPGNQDEGDYLRMYQVRKQTVNGSKESDPAIGSKAATMKAHLLTQPRVRMLIPAAQGESKDAKQSVTLNGYRLDLPKNAYVNVPEQIADVLGESLMQTDAALQVNRIDGDKRRESALL